MTLRFIQLTTALHYVIYSALVKGCKYYQVMQTKIVWNILISNSMVEEKIFIISSHKFWVKKLTNFTTLNSYVYILSVAFY